MSVLSPSTAVGTCTHCIQWRETGSQPLHNQLPARLIDWQCMQTLVIMMWSKSGTSKHTGRYTSLHLPIHYRRVSLHNMVIMTGEIGQVGPFWQMGWQIGRKKTWWDRQQQHFLSSLRGRQLLNCLALRLPIGPNVLPLINQKPNDKGKGLYPP